MHIRITAPASATAADTVQRKQLAPKLLHPVGETTNRLERSSMEKASFLNISWALITPPILENLFAVQLLNRSQTSSLRVTHYNDSQDSQLN
jgi:hypothetical protein